jgi:hypothetical protein
LGLDKTTIRAGNTVYGSYEIKAEKINKINNFKSSRIKTKTEKGTPEFWEVLERETGIEIVTDQDEYLLYSIRVDEEESDEYPEIPVRVSDYIQNEYKSRQTDESDSKYILIEPFDSDGELKAEGWTDGDSKIQADLDADSQSEGKSRGLEIGAFSRSKISSKSSIEGDISGQISDNTYSTDVKYFSISGDRIIVDSEIRLDLHLSEIDNIIEQKNGVVIDIGSSTFRINGLSNSGQVSEAVEFARNQISGFDDEPEEDMRENASDNNIGDKIRELKDLHEEGILTDKEFESKKEDLLDEF